MRERCATSQTWRKEKKSLRLTNERTALEGDRDGKRNNKREIERKGQKRRHAGKETDTETEIETVKC